MKNNGKPSKTKGNEKKHEVANEQMNENLDSKLHILTPNQEIFKNERKFSCFIILISFYYDVFFDFVCPWHLKSRKTMKINENYEKQWKTIKNKGT